MSDIYTVNDVLKTKYIEGENLYNKAYEYGRNDLCLIIANRRRLGLRLNLKVLTDFKKNVNLYEETGKQIYKDKATGRYNHRLLWQAFINYIVDDRDLSIGVVKIKKKVLKEQKLPTPWRNLCYACVTECDLCPISKKVGKCYEYNSSFVLLCEAVKSGNKQKAIRLAKAIMEAWEE